MSLTKFRMDQIAAQIYLSLGMETTSTREDADNVAFLSRDLLFVRKQVLEVQYPELLGMVFVPPAREPTPIGATHSTYNYTDRSGKARLAGAMPRGNIPRVDVKAEQATPIEIQSIVAAYGWNKEEMRSAIYARKSLSADRAIAARKTIAQEHDDIILLGDGTSDYKFLRGLFNLPITGGNSVVVYTVPNGDAGLKTFESKTALEIVKTLHGLCNAIQTASNGVEVATHVGLPLSSYTEAATKKMGDGDATSALDYFITQRKRLTGGKFQDVLSSIKLETVGAGGTKRSIAYDRNPDKVYRDDQIEFEQEPPQIDGYETIVNCQARTAAVINPYTKSIAYGDGI